MKRLLLYLTPFIWCVFIGTSVAQGQTVNGTVIDAQSDQPMPGVNISVKGTTTGTSTDADGSYNLTVPSRNDTLVFSFIGYQTQEVPINGRTSIDVELQSQAISGEELVVTAFGLERESKSLTYSTQDVNTEQLTEARELNVVNSLSGKVAGISVNQGGTGVGSSSRVILRGNRSITGSSEPLYVVDGVPIRGEVSDLNPDDIVNIDVLKGPNAAALYGSAAQNGAIVISTRRGQAGQINVSYNSTFMLRDPILLTEYQNEYGQGSGGNYDPGSEYSWGPRMDGQMVDFWSPDPSRAGEQYSFSPQPNNVSDAFQRGYNLANNLTASIGGENTQTVFTYTNTNAEGMVPNNTMERHNVSVRVNSQLTSNLALDSKLSYMNQVIENSLSTGGNFSNPIRHIYRLPRNIQTAHMENFEYTAPDGQRRQHFWNPLSNGGANPYWTMNRNLSEQPRERVIALASLTYDFTDAFSLMVRGSYDGEAGTSETKYYNDTYVIGQNGYYAINKSNAYVFNGDFLLSYTQNLTEDWNVDANFGGNIKQQRNDAVFTNTGQALTVPNFFTLSNTQNVVASQSVGSPVDVHSLYAFGQIGWRDVIYLDITGRNDWSSTLPADSRSYFYPSVGLSAILTDLIPAFPDFFTFAKARASWARVGNSAPPFMTQRTASFSAGGNNGYLQLSTTLPNEDLRPEETESVEFGLDLRFYEGRLGLDFTAYQTNTRDQLFQVAVPVGSGATSFFTNGGDVSNKGIEVLLSTNPVQSRDFNWDLDFNFSRNRNMVESISEEQPILTIATDFLRSFRIEEGKPFGVIYGRGFERDDQGRIVVGSDGMPGITAGLNVPVANFNPDWTGGISSTFSYKNLSASFLIDHRQGGSMVSFTNAIIDADGVTKRTLAGREGGVVFGQDIFADETAVMADGSPNTTAIDPEVFWRGVGGRNAPVGEAFVEEATNTRLREFTLGYNFSQSMLAGLPVSNLKISLVGRNLFFLYRESENMDPDILIHTNASAEGLSSFAPPTARSFGANLKIDF